MNYSHIRIELEEKLGKELFESFQGDIIQEIIKEAKTETVDNEVKSIFEGHSFKVTQDMAPSLFATCKNVKEKLKFDEDIDFYVTNSPELNAMSYSRVDENENHIITINSGIIDKLDHDELCFVIGHEIGHLISKNANLMRLINFVFTEDEIIPLIYTNKINLWYKLSELTADRYGYIASPNLEKCLSCFFKLASGLDPQKIDFDAEAYLKENDKIIDYFKANHFTNILSHPINPIRIKAIELFYKSNLYKKIINGEKTRRDKTLEKKVQDLIQILLVLSSSELDLHRRNFIASAGLIMSGIDTDISQDEYENIIEMLSNYTIFPKIFIEEIYKSENVNEIFQSSLVAILEQNPAERFSLFQYLIEMALSDNQLEKDEINFLYEIGEDLFGLTRKETAQFLAQAIHEMFIPNIL